MTNFSSIEYFESAMVNMIQEYRLLQEQLRESQVARDKLERTLRMERKRFQSFENSQVKELQKRAKHLESQIVECKKKNVLLEMELKSSSGAFNAKNSNMYEFAYQLNQGETIERLRKLQNFQKQNKHFEKKEKENICSDLIRENMKTVATITPSSNSRGPSPTLPTICSRGPSPLTFAFEENENCFEFDDELNSSALSFVEEIDQFQMAIMQNDRKPVDSTLSILNCQSQTISNNGPSSLLQNVLQMDNSQRSISIFIDEIAEYHPFGKQFQIDSVHLKFKILSIFDYVRNIVKDLTKASRGYLITSTMKKPIDLKFLFAFGFEISLSEKGYFEKMENSFSDDLWNLSIPLHQRPRTSSSSSSSSSTCSWSCLSGPLPPGILSVKHCNFAGASALGDDGFISGSAAGGRLSQDRVEDQKNSSSIYSAHQNQNDIENDQYSLAPTCENMPLWCLQQQEAGQADLSIDPAKYFARKSRPLGKAPWWNYVTGDRRVSLAGSLISEASNHSVTNLTLAPFFCTPKSYNIDEGEKDGILISKEESSISKDGSIKGFQRKKKKKTEKNEWTIQNFEEEDDDIELTQADMFYHQNQSLKKKKNRNHPTPLPLFPPSDENSPFQFLQKIEKEEEENLENKKEKSVDLKNDKSKSDSHGVEVNLGDSEEEEEEEDIDMITMVPGGSLQKSQKDLEIAKKATKVSTNVEIETNIGKLNLPPLHSRNVAKEIGTGTATIATSAAIASTIANSNVNPSIRKRGFSIASSVTSLEQGAARLRCGSGCGSAIAASATGTVASSTINRSRSSSLASVGYLAGGESTDSSCVTNPSSALKLKKPKSQVQLLRPEKKLNSNSNSKKGKNLNLQFRRSQLTPLGELIGECSNLSMECSVNADYDESIVAECKLSLSDVKKKMKTKQSLVDESIPQGEQLNSNLNSKEESHLDSMDDDDDDEVILNGNNDVDGIDCTKENVDVQKSKLFVARSSAFNVYKKKELPISKSKNSLRISGRTRASVASVSVVALSDIDYCSISSTGSSNHSFLSNSNLNSSLVYEGDNEIEIGSEDKNTKNSQKKRISTSFVRRNKNKSKRDKRRISKKSFPHGKTSSNSCSSKHKRRIQKPPPPPPLPSQKIENETEKTWSQNFLLSTIHATDENESNSANSSTSLSCTLASEEDHSSSSLNDSAISISKIHDREREMAHTFSKQNIRSVRAEKQKGQQQNQLEQQQQHFSQNFSENENQYNANKSRMYQLAYQSNQDEIIERLRKLQNIQNQNKQLHQSQQSQINNNDDTKKTQSDLLQENMKTITATSLNSNSRGPSPTLPTISSRGPSPLPQNVIQTSSHSHLGGLPVRLKVRYEGDGQTRLIKVDALSERFSSLYSRIEEMFHQQIQNLLTSNYTLHFYWKDNFGDSITLADQKDLDTYLELIAELGPFSGGHQKFYVLYVRLEENLSKNEKFSEKKKKISSISSLLENESNRSAFKKIENVKVKTKPTPPPSSSLLKGRSSSPLPIVGEEVRVRRKKAAQRGALTPVPHRTSFPFFNVKPSKLNIKKKG
eukprot:g2601.t1